MKRQSKISYLLAVILLLISINNYYASASSDVKSSTVINVHDGDTVTVLDHDNRQIKVRLSEIDAPELKQPYGSKAKQELSSLVFGRDVELVIEDIDRYGRTVAHIKFEGLDINAEMVKRGAAWVYREYSNDQNLLSLEISAKEARLGFWKLPPNERIEPWIWRKMQKEQRRRNRASH